MRKNNIMTICGLIVFCVIFVNLFTYSAIFAPEDTEAEDIKMVFHKKNTVEGSFLDANGEVIFAPEESYVTDTAHLPVEYSYLLGYNHYMYGTSGLRKLYKEHLYDDDGTGKGGSIQLTIDNVLQKKAYAMLKDNNLSGSVIVMDAKNAEILAMAGRQKRDYDINLLNMQEYGEKDEDGVAKFQKTWNKYLATEEFFIDPSTRDRKAPGSVYKVVTSAAAIVNGMEDYTYVDEGEIVVDGKTITNATSYPHGEETLQSALSHSTNTYFASLSLDLGEHAMADIADSFLIGEEHEIDIDFATIRSVVDFTGGDHNLAMIGFGQGALAITPLHIAMIGQSIVNDGVMIKPTVVKGMYDVYGNSVFQNNKRVILANTVKAEVAGKVKELMLGVTIDNDEERSSGNKWREKYTENIYCKTGTAQATDGATIYNSYFLCMTDEYVILISIKDTAGYGANYRDFAEKFLKELY